VKAYITRRLLLIIPTLVVVTIMVFISIRLIPGSVIDIMVAQRGAGGDLGGSFGQVADANAIRHALGLDKSFVLQYWDWVKGIVTHGNLGNSLWTHSTVTTELANRLPVTFELGLMAFVIALVISIPVGIYSAIRQDTFFDLIGRSIAIIAIAVPSFWLATMVMVYPSVWWGWTPPMLYVSFTADPLRNLGMMVIPAVILGMAMSGATMRYTRTMMLDVLKEDYVRTAWAKGLKERVVVLRHAFRNAAIPVVTILIGQITVLVGGSVIIENIFNLPGMGRLLLQVLLQRDYLMVSGLNLVYAVIGVLLILITDLSYAYLDPRIRYR
jgi:peptide/nickel transport system permease protein